MPKRVSGDILKMPIERNPENMDVIDSELLMNFFKKRNIEYLYHFTPVANLYSIIKNGLLPVYELKKRNLEFINPDQNRLDFRTRGISLSISHTNNRLLYKNICSLKIPFVVTSNSGFTEKLTVPSPFLEIADSTSMASFMHPYNGQLA